MWPKIQESKYKKNTNVCEEISKITDNFDFSKKESIVYINDIILQRCENQLYSLHQKLMQSCLCLNNEQIKKILSTEIYYAGGCIRSLLTNQLVNDYDIYFKNPESSLNFKGYLKNLNKNSAIILAETDNAITIALYGIKYQFITKYFGEPLDLISKFDYTNCMAYYDPNINNGLYVTTQMIYSIHTKWIEYNPKAWNPAQSLKRLIKFISQGYKIKNKDLAKLAEHLKSTSTEDIKALIKNDY